MGSKVSLLEEARHAPVVQLGGSNGEDEVEARRHQRPYHTTGCSRRRIRNLNLRARNVGPKPHKTCSPGSQYLFLTLPVHGFVGLFER